MKFKDYLLEGHIVSRRLTNDEICSIIRELYTPKESIKEISKHIKSFESSELIPNEAEYGCTITSADKTKKWCLEFHCIVDDEFLSKHKPIFDYNSVIFSTALENDLAMRIGDYGDKKELSVCVLLPTDKIRVTLPENEVDGEPIVMDLGI